MNMNVRFGRKLVLLALACAAAPISADAANPGGPAFSAPRNVTHASSADKASEARRLADQAAILAKRAAQLAAESEAEGRATVIHQTTPWTNRDAAEVLISDADPQPLPPVTPAAAPNTAAQNDAVLNSAAPNGTGAVPSIGWRSHSSSSASPASAIRFSDPSVPAAGNVAAVATRTPVTTTAESQGAAAPSTPPSSTESFELKLAEAALSSQPAAENVNHAAIQTVPIASTTEADVALPTNVSLQAQSIAEESYRIATMTKFADAKVRTADSEEPMPAPDAPYSNDRPLGVGEGEPCECLDGSCCPPPRPLFWTSGIEATFLAPDLNDGWAGFSVLEVADNRFDEFSTDTDDIDDLYVAPRLWLGVQGCLWGANVRYWHLRANEGSYDPVLGSDGS